MVGQIRPTELDQPSSVNRTRKPRPTTHGLTTTTGSHHHRPQLDDPHARALPLRSMKPTSPKALRGFTLIEMLAVITIIVILAAITVGSLQYVKDKEHVDRAKVQIQLLCKAIEDYKLDNGAYPLASSGTNGGNNGTSGNVSTDGSRNSNLLFKALFWDTNNDGKGADVDTTQKIYCAELDPLQKKQAWIQGTGEKATIVDPWFNEYQYRIGDSSWNPDFDLWSKGKDGKTNSSVKSANENKDDIGNF